MSRVTDGASAWWDEWRGSLNGVPTFWLKRLLFLPLWKRNGKRLGCRVDLHKFVGADDHECFHTHPAYAVRIVLWGGYVEEEEGVGTKTWFPGMVGLVRPAFSHRIQALVNGRVSYSLWLRGPVIADVHLRGIGWPKDTQTQNSKT